MHLFTITGILRLAVLSAVTVCCFCSPSGVDQPGVLHVASSGLAQYFLLDREGNYVLPQGCYTNTDYSVSPGIYSLMLNGSILEDVHVESGSQTIKKAGCVSFRSFVPSYVTIGYADQSFRMLYLSQPQVELFPGTYSIQIGGRMQENLQIVAEEIIQVPTGSLQVVGDGSSRYALSDHSGRILGTNGLNQVTMALQGSYSINLNGSAMESVEISSGQETVVKTGTLLLLGTGNGKYSFSDSLGRILESNIPVNTVLPIFPGMYSIELGKIRKTNCIISAGTETRLPTGSVWVRGNGIGYFYVCDSLGKRLSAYTTGIQLDLFPGKYGIEIQRIVRTVLITPDIMGVVETGSLVVNGNPRETVILYDENQLVLTGTQPVNTEIELHPGTYSIQYPSGALRTITVSAGKSVSISPE